MIHKDRRLTISPLILVTFWFSIFTVSIFGQFDQNKSDEEWLNKGVEQLSEKKFAQAISSFTKCLKLNEGNVQCLIKRGSTYPNVNKYLEAIEDLDKAIELAPNLAEAYLERGKLAIGDDEKIPYFTKAIELKPDYSEAYYQRGLSYFLNDTAKSFEDNTKVIELDPTNFEAHITRGNISRLDGKLSEALADYSKAIEINPDDRTFYIRGQMYLELSFFNKAVSDLTKSAELRPDYYWTYINRATAYRRLRKIKLAQADEQKAAQIGKPQ